MFRQRLLPCCLTLPSIIPAGGAAAASEDAAAAGRGCSSSASPAIAARVAAGHTAARCAWASDLLLTALVHHVVRAPGTPTVFGQAPA